MNKFLLYIFIILCSHAVKGQAQENTKVDAKKAIWKKEKEYLKYQKEKEYEGPKDWYGSSPSSINQEEINSSNNPSNQGIQYNPQRIQKDRDKQFGGYDRGGSKGDLKFDPEVKRPDPITIPKIDPPDINPPNVPNVNAPIIPAALWKVLLFLLLFGVIIFFIYLWLKNKQPSDKKILMDVENNWNPEIITKTELELRLEEAISREDYREGVRIYFTFILKELIRKNWIRWKKDKTNFQYILEMRSTKNAHEFEECVRIYDLVWYGEYEINKGIFERLRPVLEIYYQSLDPKNE